MARVLYKYRNIGDLKNEELDPYLCKLLEGELYFSDPKDFNDPFDCKLTFVIQGTDDELRNDMIRRGNPPDIVEMIIKTMSREAIAALSVKDANRKFDLSRVFCLGRDQKNKLMWAHYGQYHYGVCVGIGTVSYNDESYVQVRPRQLKVGVPTPDERLIPLIPIEYSVSRPEPVNILRSRPDGLMRFLKTKSIDWQYEQEERLTLPVEWLLTNPVKIPLQTIREVIFGLRTPTTMRKKLIDFSRKLGHQEFYEIIENERTYDLEIRKIAI